MSYTLSFEAHDYSLKDVLFSNWKFKVPRYQRPYTWNEDQLSDFWLDLTADDSSYFFGSFILNREFEKDSGYIEIVDGQQRMMTVTILIAVIRDILRDIDNKFAGVIQRKDIAFEDRSGRESYRIKCSDSASKFFTENIQSKDANMNEARPVTQEEKRIKKNYEFFMQKLTSEIEKLNGYNSKREFLIDLRDRVSNLIVIKIEIEGEEAAYEIFETTNARGVDLSIADLLKNLIFKNIRERGDRDTAKEIWSEIVQNIQETNTEIKRFIRYYWISRYSMVTEKNLFRSIKRNSQDWQLLLKDLRKASEDYNKLIEGTKEDWMHLKHGDKIFRSIEAIRYMNVSQCYVLLLSILRNYDKLGTDPVRVFQLIEKFTFLYSAVCKQPANKLEKLYSKYAKEIEAVVINDKEKKIPGNINRLFSRFEADLKEEKPSYELFREKFSEIAYVNSQQKRVLIKYILSMINNHGKTGEYRIDFDNVNIEHVLPLDPIQWGLKKAQVKTYVNLLGNLTLVLRTFNSTMGNNPLNEKLDELSESEIEITKDLVTTIRERSNTWDEESIKERQKKFSSCAYQEIWKFD